MPCLVPRTTRVVLHDVGHRAQYFPLPLVSAGAAISQVKGAGSV